MSCDSNGFVQVSSVNKDPNSEATQVNSFFKAHDGPVWNIAWAHPKYENVFATAGYDRFVRVWKEQNR